MSSSSLQTLFVLWLNFVLVAVPVRVVCTYAELLIGAIISGSGHVTDALLAVGHQKHFSTYYWLIENAKWSWLKVALQLIQLIGRCFPRLEWNLIVDDFICPRVSKNAPQAKYHHEHSRKPNRPQYIWGQQWVVLGLALTWGNMSVALPLIPRLHKGVGNRTKITTAQGLVRAVLASFRKTGQEKIRCLVDAWYMKCPFILPLLKREINVIGQVRKDTALFKHPPATAKKKRGRRKKYGKQFTARQVEKLTRHQATIKGYGGRQVVQYRSTKCLARFLSGRSVIAVWCKYPEQKEWMLILSTDLTLTPEQIIKLYARRWKIEPMFNEIKHSYGVADTWEQTSANLHRWVSMLCMAYSLTRMLSVLASAKKHRRFVPLVQWRVNRPVTAGLIRMGLQLFFRQFSFIQLWEPKSKKFVLSTKPKRGKNAQTKA